MLPVTNLTYLEHIFYIKKYIINPSIHGIIDHQRIYCNDPLVHWYTDPLKQLGLLVQ